MRKNNEVVFTPQQEENHEMVGNFRHFKDSIWWPVVKSLPRSTAVLLFPVMLIIGAFAYTRTLDTHVSIVCYYWYYCCSSTSNVGWLNVCAYFNVIRCYLFISYVTVVWSIDTLWNSLEIVRNGVWIPLAWGMHGWGHDKINTMSFRRLAHYIRVAGKNVSYLLFYPLIIRMLKWYAVSCYRQIYSELWYLDIQVYCKKLDEIPIRWC